MSSNKPIAKCYLEKENIEDNVALLFEDTLIINHHGRKSSFPNNSILSIYTKHKTYLAPIIFGGISASLSAIALLNFYGNVWVMLTLLFGGCFVVYYGWQGGTAMVIHTSIKEYDYFFKNISNNLRNFIDFTNQYLTDREAVVYFQVNENQLAQAAEKGYFKVGDIHLFLTPPKANSTLFNFKVILSKSGEFEIKYEYNYQNQLEPKLIGSLPLSSVEQIPMLD